MENATKALIIAAAILIAIVLISLGVFVLGQGTGAAQDSSTGGLGNAQTSAYNSEWENYMGKNITGTSVKKLLAAVEQHNRTIGAEDSSKIISVEGYNNPGSVGTGKTYRVVATGWTSAGYISKIRIDESTNTFNNYSGRI